MTKLTGLSTSNVLALRIAFPGWAPERLTVTSTTATFADPAVLVLQDLDEAMAKMPTRGHPRASLHAVRRKLVKAATTQGAIGRLDRFVASGGDPDTLL